MIFRITLFSFFVIFILLSSSCTSDRERRGRRNTCFEKPIKKLSNRELKRKVNRDSYWEYCHAMRRTIQYQEGKGGKFLDLYLPEKDRFQGNKPLIIFAHSGGFLYGSKNNPIISHYAMDFARAGYVTASINYTLVGENLKGVISEWSSGQSHIKTNLYHAIQDANSAVRYFSANYRKYGIDPDRIYFAGFSAGGVLAQHLAFLSDSEAKEYFGNNCTSELCGVKVMKESTYSQSLDKLKLAGVLAIGAGVFDESFIEDTDETPLFMMHGEEDKIFPIGRGSVFDEFVRDITIDLPGPVLVDSSGSTIAEMVYDIVPEQVVNVFRDLVTQNMKVSGSGAIYKRRGKSHHCRLYRVEGGGHCFMLSEGTKELNAYYDKSLVLMNDFLETYP